MKTSSTILSHRVTYSTKIQNTSDNPLSGIRVFVAFPPPLPPRQELINLSSIPVSGRQATDLKGNHWLDLTCDRLAGKETFTCGYTALVRNRSIHYRLPQSTRNSSVPSSLVGYTKPENFIESHHHLIKDLARDLSSKNPNPIPFVKAAMRAVTKTIRYSPQKYERGAAFAIEKHVGDCTEFAALFTALCRAKGIPARLEAGFAYNRKKWERHAWSVVWIQDNWIPVDPTWYGNSGWLGVTNRHIPLIIGNWMDIRIHQEFKMTWSHKPQTTPPQLGSKWKVTKVVSILNSS